MGKTCLDCGIVVKTWTDSIHFPGTKIKGIFFEVEISDSIVDKMGNDDVLCKKCGNKAFCRHAVNIYNYNKSKLLPEEFELLLKSGEDWIPIAQAELASSTHTQVQEPSSKSVAVSSTPTPNSSSERITTVDELTRMLDIRHDEFKRIWQNGSVVQFKNDKIAILMRAFRSQVQFLVAYDQVTREGFRLMAIDEGKEGSAGGFTGGVTSYYYFQKIDYVR